MFETTLGTSCSKSIGPALDVCVSTQKCHRPNQSELVRINTVATPKQIRELMKVDGLTNDEVKSHLQVLLLLLISITYLVEIISLALRHLSSSIA